MLEGQNLGSDVGQLMVALFGALHMLSQPALARQLYGASLFAFQGSLFLS